MRPTPALVVALSLSAFAATARAECNDADCWGVGSCTDAGSDFACNEPDAATLQMAPPEEKDPGSCSCLWYNHDDGVSAAAAFGGALVLAARRRPATGV